MEVTLFPLDRHDSVRERLIILSPCDREIAQHRLRSARSDAKAHLRDRIQAWRFLKQSHHQLKLLKLSGAQQKVLCQVLHASFPREVRPRAVSLPCRLSRENTPLHLEALDLVDVSDPWNVRVSSDSDTRDVSETAPCVARWTRAKHPPVVVHDLTHFQGNVWQEWGLSCKGQWFTLHSLLCKNGGQGFLRSHSWTNQASRHPSVRPDAEVLKEIALLLDPK
jgi:hypothetical protein